MTLANGVAAGGGGGGQQSQGGGGGGGLGAGGALFVNTGANVTLAGVALSNNGAVGGAGGSAGGGGLFDAGGGGGGLGGDGGQGGYEGGGGGGGLEGNGGSVPSGVSDVAGGGGGGNTASGGNGVGNTPGTAGGAEGGGGGVYGSGGGAGSAFGGGGGGGTFGAGGAGGDFGGGGGAGYASANGGAGGFGGGGGGGGGDSGVGAGGVGGFGGGNGGSIRGGGDGGDALGGAIFVRDGGTLTIIDGSLSGGDVTAGAGGAGNSNGVAGSAEATAFYVMGQTVTVQTDNDTAVAGTIGGAGGLEKTGAAMLVLTGTNTYSGGTEIDEGAVSVSADANLGDASGGLTFDGGTLQVTGTDFTGTTRGIVWGDDGGAFDIADQNNTFVVDADLSGPGGLAKLGAGTLMLTGANTYSGATTIEAGTLKAGAADAFSSESAYALSPGATLDLGGYDHEIGPLSGSGGTIQSTGGPVVLTINQAADGVYAGGVLGNDGAVELVKNGAAALTMTGINQVSAVTVNLGLLKADSALALGSGSATLTVNGGTLDITNHGDTVSALSGTGGFITTSMGTGFLVVDQAADTVFDGTIQNGAGMLSLTKTDAGRLTLNGVNGYTGLTTVSGGTLIVGDDTHPGANIAGAVQVDAGGTLGGSGTIAGAAVIDGTLSAGNSPGTLSFAGDLTLNAGSTSIFELNTPGVVGGSDPATGNDLVEVGGTLALGGELQAHVASAGFYRLFDYGALAVGSTFDTETVSSSRGGFDVASYGVDTGVPGQVNLSVLGTGQTMQFWDGTDMTGNGVVDGGNGTWASFGGNWTDSAGAANGGWGGSVGVFAGAPGLVSILGPQNFDTLQFKTDGYRVEGDALSIGVAEGGTFNTDAGTSIIIDADIIDGVGNRLVKVGGGTLVLYGGKSYTGGTVIDGGTVAIQQDASLGAASGGLSLNNGMLSITSDVDTSRTITLAGDGSLNTVGATTLSVDGEITGAGNLIKRGDGTLVLAGANAYGDTIVREGTVVGDVGSISGDIGNAGTVVFQQSGDGSFAGDITGIYGTDGTMSKSGAGVLTLTGASTLDWNIEAGGLLTDAARFTGAASIESAASLSFDDAGDASYAGKLSGSGVFAKTGAGTLLLSGDSSAFSGTTTVAAGALIVGDSADAGDAVLGGDIDVLDGVLLGGHGTVGSTGSMVTIGAGASLAPGHSIGTLHVAGDLNFAAGSELTVEADPAGTDADLVAVAGHVSIDGGTVVHVGPDGGFRQQATYTILTAGNGIDGSFDAVTSNFAFLDAALAQSADEIDLILSRNDTGFDNPAETRNQRAVAGAIEQMPAGDPVYDAILGLPDDDDVVRASFDALSGEVHASAGTVFIEDSAILRNAINDRLRSAFDDIGAGSVPMLSYAGDVPQVMPADPERFALWGQAFGAWGHYDGNGNAGEIDSGTGGFIMGGDAMAGDWRLGLLASYGHTGFDIDDRNSSASSEDYSLGLYGGTQWGNVAFRSGLAYTWHDIDTSRSVAIPGLTDSFDADYRAATAQAFAELGYRIDMGSATFEPFANLAYVHLNREGFSEKGGPGALSASEGNAGTTFTTLGLRAASRFSMGTTIASVHAMIGWRHAMGDIEPNASLAFAGSPDFTIAGAPLARDTALVEAGIDLNLSDTATLGFSYTGQLAGNAHNDNLKASLQVKF